MIEVAALDGYAGSAGDVSEVVGRVVSFVTVTFMRYDSLPTLSTA